MSSLLLYNIGFYFFIFLTFLPFPVPVANLSLASGDGEIDNLLAYGVKTPMFEPGSRQYEFRDLISPDSKLRYYFNIETPFLSRFLDLNLNTDVMVYH